jgi:hypothetical protein
MRTPAITVVGILSTEPFPVNERSGRRRRVGFSVDVYRRWHVQRLEGYQEATTTFDVRCAGFIAGSVLTELNLGDRVVCVGHFEQTDGGSLELHADVIALALSDEPRDAGESAAAAA